MGERYDKKGKEKEMQFKIKQSKEIKSQCGSRQNDLLKDHIHMRNHRRVRGLNTESPCPSVSSLRLSKKSIIKPHIFLAVYTFLTEHSMKG